MSYLKLALGTRKHCWKTAEEFHSIEQKKIQESENALLLSSTETNTWSYINKFAEILLSRVEKF